MAGVWAGGAAAAVAFRAGELVGPSDAPVDVVCGAPVLAPVSIVVAELAEFAADAVLREVVSAGSGSGPAAVGAVGGGVAVAEGTLKEAVAADAGDTVMAVAVAAENRPGDTVIEEAGLPHQADDEAPALETGLLAS